MLQLRDDADATDDFFDELMPGPFDEEFTPDILQLHDNQDDDDGFGGIDIDGNDIRVKIDERHQARLQPLDPRSSTIPTITTTTTITNQNVSLVHHYQWWQYDRLPQATTKSFFLNNFKPSIFKPPLGTNLMEADAVYTWLNQMLFIGMLANLVHVPQDTDTNLFQCTFHEMAIALEYDLHVALGVPRPISTPRRCCSIKS